ncbi:hypothetical protein M378DRAFT_168926, partial [Amanita muscaria Koide BX008]
MQGRTPFADSIANGLSPSIAIPVSFHLMVLTVKFGCGCIDFLSNGYHGRHQVSAASLASWWASRLPSKCHNRSPV